MAIDALSTRAGAPAGRVEADAWLAEAAIGGETVLLVKPLSYMNLSGLPLARLLAATGGGPADLLVLVDVAIELGSVRVRERGSHGGHNGLRSIAETLGSEEFTRVRIGVRRGDLPEDLAEYVLADFPPDEVLLVQEAVGLAADAALCALASGTTEAMNRFNGRKLEL
jgi:PTH1 family peptidyl-tRNA hydrolase